MDGVPTPPRHASVGDAEAIARIYGSSVTESFTSFEEKAATPEEIRGRMAAGPRLRGSGGYERLIPELRGLGYVSLFAAIAEPNPASVGLHEAFGFERIGAFPSVGFKLGAWHDVGWWRLQLVPSLPAHPVQPGEWTGRD